MKDFFISYNKADTQWAEWVAWQLEGAGYTTYFQAWDFGLGANFIVEMDRALKETRHTILLLSPDFLSSEYCKAEWSAVFLDDVTGVKRTILPVIVRKCDPPKLLAPRVRLALNTENEDAAREELLRAIRTAVRLAEGKRAVPSQAPRWPGVAAKPIFPPRRSAEIEAIASAADAFTPPPLSDGRATRAPIVIAVEQIDRPIQASMLLQVERHLTVSLNSEDVETLARMATVKSPDAQESLVHDGRTCWDILQRAQPRLRVLFQNVRSSELRQPVAWTGHGELLHRIHIALLIARMPGEDGIDDILSVGFGDHYFNPLPDADVPRLLPRSSESPSSTVLSVDRAPGPNVQAMVVNAPASEVLVIASDQRTDALHAAFEAIARADANRCRVAVGFGEGEILPSLVQLALTRVPCLSVGGTSLRDRMLPQALAEAMARDGRRLAIPSIVAAFRRAWIRHAVDAADTQSLLDGLGWTTWSWIGRPLFAVDLDEVVPAAYPHLTDLRTVASSDWYFPREADIPPRYHAGALAREKADKKDPRFHLYLSGAGGTGKSCFLRFVYERLAKREDVVAIWYRVDAPSSEWETVERRLKEQAELATIAKLGDEEGRRILPSKTLDLSEFLMRLAANLKRLDPPLSDVFVVIDQLERTFESGDEPDPTRLSTISKAVMNLLKDVKGEAIRVFIASRKQYLPDFLRSYQEAKDSGLHFNVLQTISSTEHNGFVQRVRTWCRDQELIDRTLRIEPAAAEMLGHQVDGHPLNLMLTLIQLFSQVATGTIDEELVNELRPWERKFHFDLQLAAKDDLDWYFLLAMAAARTEIVRTEEVWWRIRLISAALTERARQIGPKGLLERLWLVGHLGRTIYARPDDKTPGRFLEFFHANLRDYLVRDVMGTGGAELNIPGRTGGTPPTWRALDRLASAARDWEHTQQALPQDELAVLMQHRDVVTEPVQREGEPQREPFSLLFLRDAKLSRTRLCGAARECLVFSALVHDNSASWAFEKLFRDPADRITCCEKWLKRSDQDSRLRILQYLVEFRVPAAREFLAKLVLPNGTPEFALIWREIADVLAEPLYAERYRVDVVYACLEINAERSEPASALPDQLSAFIVGACEGSRPDVLRTILKCADRAAGSQNARLRELASLLRDDSLVDALLAAHGRDSEVDARNPREVNGKAPPPVERGASGPLGGEMEHLLGNGGSHELGTRLGVPLPPFVFRKGEVPDLRDENSPQTSDEEAELRLAGQSVALGVFYPAKGQVLKRAWDRVGRELPSTAHCVYDDGLRDVVLWMDRESLTCTNGHVTVRSWNEAMLDWLERELRANLDEFFDLDLLVEFMRDIASRMDVSLLFRNGITLQVLRHVVVSLVRERVPVWPHRYELMQELQQLFGTVEGVDTLIQKLRESVAMDLCRTFAGSSGQLVLLTLDPRLEEQLVRRLTSTAVGDVLRLSTSQARALASAAQRFVEQSLQEKDAVPVLVTLPVLRRPLFDVLHQFDRRVYTLSVTELRSRVQITVLGEIAGDVMAPAHA